MIDVFAEQLPPRLHPLTGMENVILTPHVAELPMASFATTNNDETARIQRALESTSGDRLRAAAILGMSRTTLWRRMRALGLLQG